MMEACTIPPQGWACTRGAGHAGPCAAVPAGEANYRAWKALDPEAQPDGTLEGLAVCASMLEEYGPDCFPANENGQVPFARSMMDATAEEIRAYLAKTTGAA